MSSSTPALRFRLLLDSDHAIGPGKTDLLDAIARTGSISAAARAMAMSYKRAWQLVDELNRSFVEVLVTTTKGGKRGGGASLTPLGVEVLRAYRSLEHKAQRLLASELRALGRLRAKK
ncbi:MAG: LysR family transcriptional regulator [Rudaea sp.]